jgi:hypothetical protein
MIFLFVQFGGGGGWVPSSHLENNSLFKLFYYYYYLIPFGFCSGLFKEGMFPTPTQRTFSKFLIKFLIS